METGIAMGWTRYDVLDSLEYTSAKATSDQCSPWEILSLILTYALKKFVKGDYLILPKWFNLFKWLGVGKFLYDTIQLIIFCVRNRKGHQLALDASEFKSKETISILQLRYEHQVRYDSCIEPDFQTYAKQKFHVRANI